MFLPPWSTVVRTGSDRVKLNEASFSSWKRLFVYWPLNWEYTSAYSLLTNAVEALQKFSARAWSLGICKSFQFLALVTQMFLPVENTCSHAFAIAIAAQTTLSRLFFGAILFARAKLWRFFHGPYDGSRQTLCCIATNYCLSPLVLFKQLFLLYPCVWLIFGYNCTSSRAGLACHFQWAAHIQPSIKALYQTLPEGEHQYKIWNCSTRI